MTTETIRIIWDPAVLSDEEYAKLVVAIGDLVRAHGGLGIERVASTTHVLGLEKERLTYEQELVRLIAEGHAGKWVLIKGEELVGVYADMQEALKAGYDRFGLEQFMVKEVARVDRIYRV